MKSSKQAPKKVLIRNISFHTKFHVGSPTSIGHDLIEVNIYGGTFLLL